MKTEKELENGELNRENSTRGSLPIIPEKGDPSAALLQNRNNS